MSILELLMRDNKAYSLLAYNFHEEYKLTIIKVTILFLLREKINYLKLAYNFLIIYRA